MDKDLEKFLEALHDSWIEEFGIGSNVMYCAVVNRLLLKLKETEEVWNLTLNSKKDY